jgi:hypothetical protein
MLRVWHEASVPRIIDAMDIPYKVGDNVLASREQTGENHEEGTVIDAYSLLIGPETRPIVVVEFADGERVLLNPIGDDVRPVPEPEGKSGDEGDGS